MTTRWVITEQTQRVVLTNGTGEIAFAVSNPSTTPDQAMFTVIPGPGASSSWFATPNPQRPVGGQSSTTYVVTATIPANTAAGLYELQGRVYSAQGVPEETAVLSGRVVIDVPAPPPILPPPPRRWWLWAVIAAAALLLIAALVWLLRPSPDRDEPFTTPRLVAPDEAAAFADGESIELEWEYGEGQPLADEHVVVVTVACAAAACDEVLREEVGGDTTFTIDAAELGVGSYRWVVIATRGDDDDAEKRTTASRQFDVTA